MSIVTPSPNISEYHFQIFAYGRYRPPLNPLTSMEERVAQAMRTKGERKLAAKHLGITVKRINEHLRNIRIKEL